MLLIHTAKPLSVAAIVVPPAAWIRPKNRKLLVVCGKRFRTGKNDQKIECTLFRNEISYIIVFGRIDLILNLNHAVLLVAVCIRMVALLCTINNGVVVILGR